MSRAEDLSETEVRDLLDMMVELVGHTSNAMRELVPMVERLAGALEKVTNAIDEGQWTGGFTIPREWESEK